MCVCVCVVLVWHAEAPSDLSVISGMDAASHVSGPQALRWTGPEEDGGSSSSSRVNGWPGSRRRWSEAFSRLPLAPSSPLPLATGQNGEEPCDGVSWLRHAGDSKWLHSSYLFLFSMVSVLAPTVKNDTQACSTVNMRAEEDWLIISPLFCHFSFPSLRSVALCLQPRASLLNCLGACLLSGSKGLSSCALTPLLVPSRVTRQSPPPRWRRDNKSQWAPDPLPTETGCHLGSMAV